MLRRVPGRPRATSIGIVSPQNVHTASSPVSASNTARCNWLRADGTGRPPSGNERATAASAVS